MTRRDWCGAAIAGAIVAALAAGVVAELLKPDVGAEVECISARIDASIANLQRTLGEPRARRPEC